MDPMGYKPIILGDPPFMETPHIFPQVSCYTFSDAASDSAEDNGCVADLQRRIAKALGLPEVGNGGVAKPPEVGILLGFSDGS